MMEWCTPVLYGASKVVSYHRKMLNLGQFNFSQSRTIDKIQWNTFNIINCWKKIPLFNWDRIMKRVANTLSCRWKLR
jgi:4-hydroxythreonine-4-phosphate dehydrogenase